MSDHTTEQTMQVIDDLATMVGVQQESTVSRTVLRTEGGNVVLFGFDAGQELSEHTAAMPVFVQVLSGRLLVTGGDDETELVPGGFVYFPTRLPHAIKALEPSVMMLTMVTAARADDAIDR
ncbi:cupin domain-containing protein [Bifidobacterium cuniculi]|uniref:Cupin domain protein n=1 Tax=Bifidobacterium cuniculi TaxID=1688 RepID=A0A087B424_9BIFI|nr:cupin domain-containing protein [Bifidobacterium cuniculi]KFI65774.1 cupin domain protein [Bifidobacterium cuniculi]